MKFRKQVKDFQETEKGPVNRKNVFLHVGTQEISEREGKDTGTDGES